MGLSKNCFIATWFIYTYLNNVSVGSTLMRFIVFRVFKKNLVHVGAGILEQLVARVENNQRNLTVTQNAQLISFLHQSKFTLGKCDLNQVKIMLDMISNQQSLLSYVRNVPNSEGLQKCYFTARPDLPDIG